MNENDEKLIDYFCISILNNFSPFFCFYFDKQIKHFFFVELQNSLNLTPSADGVSLGFSFFLPGQVRQRVVKMLLSNKLYICTRIAIQSFLIFHIHIHKRQTANICTHMYSFQFECQFHTNHHPPTHTHTCQTFQI